MLHTRPGEAELVRVDGLGQRAQAKHLPGGGLSRLLPSGQKSEAPVSTIIVHPNPKDERVALLDKLLKQFGRDISFAPGLDEARRLLGGRASVQRPMVIVPDDRSDPTLANAVIRFAEAEGRSAYVIYVADAMSAEGYKKLVKTGSGEWIKWLSVPREIVEVIRLAEADQRQAAPTKAATVISFLPSKGGVGNTTLAVETAVTLVTRKKDLRGRVAVLDLNFQGSTLGDSLDIESRFDITEIMNRPERLDAQLVDIFSSKHASSVDVFSTPARYGHADEIRAEVIFALLDEVGSKYEIVLLDLPNHWQPWIDNLLQGSSAVVLTGETTVPGVRQVANRLKHLEELKIPDGQMAVVMNRCEAGLFGRIARKAEIERALAGRRIFYVPQNAALATEAANTGRPMTQVAPKSPAPKRIRKIGDWVEAIRQSAHP